MQIMSGHQIVDEINNRLLSDMGPVYHETNLDHLDHLVVEPFNAFSSLAMSLAAFLIWALLLKTNYKQYPFLAYIFAPLIFIGGIGSTLFHASRSSQFFLLMDWLPVLLVTILLSLFYWYKIFPKWYFVVIMTFVILFARILPALMFKGSIAINISYFVSGVLILIPLFIYMLRNQFQYWQFIAFSVVALLLALFFRYADDVEYLVLPMGTHWLWHIFSGLGAWFLGVYIFKTSQTTLESDKNQSNSLATGVMS